MQKDIVQQVLARWLTDNSLFLNTGLCVYEPEALPRILLIGHLLTGQ